MGETLRARGGRVLREQPLQLLRMAGAREGVLPVDKTAPDEIGQAFLDRDGALLPRDRDFLMQVLERVPADVLPGTVADHQQLGGRHETGPAWAAASGS